jgi:hypothetical protein
VPHGYAAPAVAVLGELKAGVLFAVLEVMIGAGQIGWMSDLEPDLLDAYDGVYEDEVITMLERRLLISDDNGGSGGRWMLHADSVAGNGEWAAYEWWPGEGGDLEPHDDFAAMVTMPPDADD